MPAVGYQGKVQIGSTVWPLRSTTVYEEPRPLIGDDIITGNASPIVFADGELVYEGSLSFPLFDAMWGDLTDFAVDARETSMDVIIDNGFDIWQYPVTGGSCLCRTLNITSNPGGLIDCTLDIKATGRETTTRPAGAISATSVANLNVHPYPWWKSCLDTGESTALGSSATAATADLQAWNVTVNNNTIADLVADCSTRYAKIIQGQLTAQGSITVINPVPITDLTNGGKLRINIGTRWIHFPNLVWTRFGVPLPGPNQRIKQTLDFTALGNGTDLAVTVSA